MGPWGTLRVVIDTVSVPKRVSRMGHQNNVVYLGHICFKPKGCFANSVRQNWL